MHDVVIIGGGYAGCLLDSLLEGLDTLLIEEKGIGSKDVSAVTFMRIIDSDDVIRNTYDSYTLMTVDGDSEKYEFGEDVFCLVDYEKLCRSLVRSDVVEGKVIRYDNGKVELENETIESKIIVDCSGINGEKLREKAGFKLPEIVSKLTFEKNPNPDWIDTSSIYMIMGPPTNFGGWIYPIDDKYVEFGRANRGKRSKNISFPDMEKSRELLGIEEGFDSKSVTYPLGFVKKVVKNSMVIFGDAAGLSHPTYGMGLHYIYKIAPKLAETIKKTVRGEGRLYDYQKIWNTALRKASGLIAAGFAAWEMPVDMQVRLTKLQIKLGISPESIFKQMWAFDEEFEVYAKHKPKFTDYPITLHLKTLLNRIKIIL